MLSKILKSVKDYQYELALIAGVILIGLTSYNLGKIQGIEGKKKPITVKQAANILSQSSDTLRSLDLDNRDQSGRSKVNSDPRVFASKKSKSKLYHFPWCPGASQIVEQNKLTFASEAEAVTAGYSLAGNCTK